MTYLKWALFMLILFLWSLGVGYPILSLLVQMSHQKELRYLWEPTVVSVIRSTLLQAALSVLVAGSLGLLLGLCIGRLRAQGIRFRLNALLAFPVGVPTVVAGAIWVMCLRPTGILGQFSFFRNWNYSLRGVILAHVFYNVPLVARAVSLKRQEVPMIQYETAQLFGAGSITQFRYVTWPNIRLSFLTSCAQVFSFCIMSFALVLILGGGPPVQTLETEIYSRLRYGSLSLGGAGACAVWEMIITLISWSFVLYLENKKFSEVDCPSHQKWLDPSAPKIKEGLMTFFLSSIVLGFILPYGLIFSHQMWMAIQNSDLRAELLPAVLISAVVSFFTACFSVILALACSFLLYSLKKKRKLSTAFSLALGLPSGISALVLGLAFWTAYGQSGGFFRGNLFGMIAIQITLFFPLAFRMIAPLLQGIQTSQLEAAFSLGASGMGAWCQIEWPRWREPVVHAFATVVGASLCEVGAVSLFQYEKAVPLPLIISRWMAQYRFEEAEGMAAFLFLLSLIAMTFTFRTSQWSPKCSEGN